MCFVKTGCKGGKAKLWIAPTLVGQFAIVYRNQLDVWKESFCYIPKKHIYRVVGWFVGKSVGRYHAVRKVGKEKKGKRKEREKERKGKEKKGKRKERKRKEG